MGREQVGCVAKTHRDAERCVIARSTHPIGSRPSPAGARPGSTPRWNQGDPPCSFPAWPPGPRQGWAAGSDRFWLCELRVSQHFSTFYGSSVQAMDTQLGAGSTADSDDSTRWRANEHSLPVAGSSRVSWPTSPLRSTGAERSLGRRPVCQDGLPAYQRGPGFRDAFQ